MMAVLIAAAVVAGTPPWPTAVIWTYGGSQSCATWLAGDAQKAQGSEWALGFWTGLNLAFGKKVGSHTDAPGVLGEIEKVCRDSPSLVLIEAARRAYADMSIAGR